ncbi:hypothetical protein ACRAWD_04505 [Caulobacter segnis]
MRGDMKARHPRDLYGQRSPGRLAASRKGQRSRRSWPPRWPGRSATSTDGYAFVTRDAAMGQAPFRAPSVFSFYPYRVPLPQGAGLIGPVSKLMTTSTTMARHNFLYDWTVGGDATRGEVPEAGGDRLRHRDPDHDWASWEAFGTDDGKILDRINLVLLNGTMTQSPTPVAAGGDGPDQEHQSRPADPQARPDGAVRRRLLPPSSQVDR